MLLLRKWVLLLCHLELNLSFSNQTEPTYFNGFVKESVTMYASDSNSSMKIARYEIFILAATGAKRQVDCCNSEFQHYFLPHRHEMIVLMNSLNKLNLCPAGAVRLVCSESVTVLLRLSLKRCQNRLYARTKETHSILFMLPK